MQFSHAAIPDAQLITLEPVRDARGSFTRLFCRHAFAEHGIDFTIAQTNLAHNPRGTLRGMHFQTPPHTEAKLVQCVHGSVYDVLVDLRGGSRTYCQWVSFELTGDDDRTLYIPPGLAHGYLTCEDDTTLLYSMSTAYHAPAAGGVRYDDPAFAIEWPASPELISERDTECRAFDPAHPPFSATSPDEHGCPT